MIGRRATNDSSNGTRRTRSQKAKSSCGACGAWLVKRKSLCVGVKCVSYLSCGARPTRVSPPESHFTLLGENLRPSSFSLAKAIRRPRRAMMSGDGPAEDFDRPWSSSISDWIGAARLPSTRDTVSTRVPLPFLPWPHKIGSTCSTVRPLAP